MMKASIMVVSLCLLVLLVGAGAVSAQRLMGVTTSLGTGGGGGGSVCTTSLVFDQSVACNAVSVMMVGL